MYWNESREAGLNDYFWFKPNTYSIEVRKIWPENLFEIKGKRKK